MSPPSTVASRPSAGVPASDAIRRALGRVGGPACYFAVTACSAFAGYWWMFTGFVPYDDTGYFMNSIRLFAQGQALYDRVFSDYGPFSYEVWAAIFGLSGHAITPDSGRMAVVALWLLTSLVLGVSCQRLTDRLAVGVIVQVLSFSVLYALTAEPMHASGVVCALLATTAAVLAFVFPVRRRTGLFMLGAITAALLLTKVNVGGFAAIALAYATVMALPALRRFTALAALATVVLVAVGPILMSTDLNQQWAQNYAILAVAATIAIALSSASPRHGRSAEASDAAIEDAREWVLWLLAGFLACAIVVVGIVVVLGTSLGAFLQETVILPTHQGSAFTLPISLTPDVVYWATAAVGAAWIVRRLRASGAPRPPLLIGALARIAVALAIWLSIMKADPLSISPANANFSLAMLLAWVAALPSTRDDGGVSGRFVRLLIATLAVMEALMAYPVAGTQVMFASLLFLVCGAICFADGWHDLEVWGEARGSVDSRRVPRIVMSTLATGLAVALAFQYVVRPMESAGNTYAGYPHLPIAGATRMHMSAGQVATFSQINTLLRSRCRSLITLPGLLSFNLWSGLPAPSGLTAEPFWKLLSRSQELSALASAKAAPGLCAVRNDEQAAGWDDGTPPPQVPLVAFIEHDFTPIAQYESYVVSVRNPEG